MNNTYWLRRVQAPGRCGYALMVHETIGGDLPDYEARARNVVRTAVFFSGWPLEARAEAQAYVQECAIMLTDDPERKPDTCSTCEGFGNADGHTICPDCMGTGRVMAWIRR